MFQKNCTPFSANQNWVIFSIIKRGIPSSGNEFRDSCDIGFQVQFNAEFTSQVMNFPIVQGLVGLKAKFITET